MKVMKHRPGMHGPLVVRMMVAMVAMLLTVATPLRDGLAQPSAPQPAPRVTKAQRTKARQLFRAGARAYDAARYDVAVEAFDQAYQIIPRAELRFSAAQALRRQHALKPDIALLKKARAYYRAYAAAAKTGSRVADAAMAITAIDAQLRQHAAANAVPAGEDPGDGTSRDPAREGPDAVATLPKRTVSTLQLDTAIWGATARVTAAPSAHFEPREVRLAPGPQWLELPPGDYKVVFSAKGYRTTERQAHVQLGRTTFVDETLLERPALISLVGQEDAEILVDGRPVGRTPLLRPLELSRGRHRIVAGSNGHDPWVKDFDVERGSQQQVPIDMAMSTQRVTTWVVLIGGGTTTLAGIVMGGLARSNGLKAENIRALSQREQRALTLAEAENYNQVLDRSDDQTIIAVGLFSGGLAISAAGLLSFLLDEPNLYEATLGAPTDMDDAGADADTSTPPPAVSPVVDGAAVVPEVNADGTIIGVSLSLTGRF